MRTSARTPTILRWSTDDVPALQRFDYYACAASSAIVPMQIEGRAPADPPSAMSGQMLGPGARL
jgi:hypothetical protein